MTNHNWLLYSYMLLYNHQIMLCCLYFCTWWFRMLWKSTLCAIQRLMKNKFHIPTKVKIVLVILSIFFILGFIATPRYQTIDKTYRMTTNNPAVITEPVTVQGKIKYYGLRLGSIEFTGNITIGTQTFSFCYHNPYRKDSCVSGDSPLPIFFPDSRRPLLLHFQFSERHIGDAIANKYFTGSLRGNIHEISGNITLYYTDRRNQEQYWIQLEPL